MLLDELRNYNIRNQNNYGSVHILHNHRGGRGSLKCLYMVMLTSFFTNLRFFINLY